MQWDPDPLELPFEPEPACEYETEMLLPRELQQTLPRLPGFVAGGLHQDRAVPNHEPTWPIEPPWSIEPEDEQFDPPPARSVRLEVLVLVALGLASLVALVPVALVIAAIALA